MDDGTAGEMVASGNYWKAMTERDDVSGEKQDSGADSGDGDGDGRGGSTSRAGGRAASTLDEVEWASIHLETGNVKVEASATAAEARFAFFCAGGVGRPRPTNNVLHDNAALTPRHQLRSLVHGRPWPSSFPFLRARKTFG